jgi:hypothetical protein
MAIAVCVILTCAGCVKRASSRASWSRHLRPRNPNDIRRMTQVAVQPAEALNVLTVGDITPDNDPFPRHAPQKAISPRRAPSPFMCTGGIKNVLKPELVAVAGNAAFDTVTRVENSATLRVPTTSHEFARGKLGFVHGKSYSAPGVAHIIERHADASPNLLRALLVQSAIPPAGVEGLAPKDALRLCGFGVPDLDRTLYCRPQRATLYYEGEIQPDEVKLFEIPVPSAFAKAKGAKAISVKVAYDPPVSVVHRDRPAGVQLTWRVARGDVTDAAVQAAIAQEAEEDVDDDASSGETPGRAVFMTGKLPKRMQQRSTVQKNVFAWTRGDYGDPYRLAVTAPPPLRSHRRGRRSRSSVHAAHLVGVRAGVRGARPAAANATCTRGVAARASRVRASREGVRGRAARHRAHAATTARIRVVRDTPARLTGDAGAGP